MPPVSPADDGHDGGDVDEDDGLGDNNFNASTLGSMMDMVAHHGGRPLTTTTSAAVIAMAMALLTATTTAFTRGLTVAAVVAHRRLARSSWSEGRKSRRPLCTPVGPRTRWGGHWSLVPWSARF